MGAKKERRAFRKFIEASIENRLAWAWSDEGRRALGPGTPTVPGLQDLHFILEWINSRDDSAEGQDFDAKPGRARSSD